MKILGLVALGTVLLGFATPASYAKPAAPRPAPRPAVVGATVSGFAPTSGRTGTLVTVTGTGFLPSDKLLVDGRPVKAPTIDASSISFAVPAGSKKGVVTLRRRGTKDLAVGTFTVLPDAKITGIEPSTGHV